MIQIGDRELINFSSNDYLGLSHDPEVIASAQNALDKYGLGSGASRLLSGGTVLHKELEEELADLKGTEQSLLFGSGYMANTGTIPAIASAQDVIFSDELNHASIIDGCRLSKAKTIIYGHCNVQELKELLKPDISGRKIVITESIFSMDGDLAPLDELYTLCKENGAILYLDDAHGIGVLGEGKGALAHFGLPTAPFVLQMGTLSKALGSMGAFVASESTVYRYLLSTARTLIFSTALPALVAAGALTALRTMRKRPEIIVKFLERIKMVHTELGSIGIDKGRSMSQIIPVMCGNVDHAMHVSGFLSVHGVHAPAIRPPSVKRPRIRISLTAAHTDEDISMLLELIGECFGKQ